MNSFLLVQNNETAQAYLARALIFADNLTNAKSSAALFCWGKRISLEGDVVIHDLGKLQGMPACHAIETNACGYIMVAEGRANAQLQITLNSDGTATYQHTKPDGTIVQQTVEPLTPPQEILEEPPASTEGEAPSGPPDAPAPVSEPPSAAPVQQSPANRLSRRQERKAARQAGTQITQPPTG